MNNTEPASYSASDTVIMTTMNKQTSSTQDYPQSMSSFDGKRCRRVSYGSEIEDATSTTIVTQPCETRSDVSNDTNQNNISTNHYRSDASFDDTSTTQSFKNDMNDDDDHQCSTGTIFGDEDTCPHISDLTLIQDQITLMLSQEETIYCCNDYINDCAYTTPSMIDDSCRRKMTYWCFQVVDYTNLRRETVSIAIQLLDRFLSSNHPQAKECITSRKEFQLASMTTLFIAIKISEPFMMDLKLLTELSRGFYVPQDFVQMEKDILIALNWHLSGPTPLMFVQYFLALLCNNIEPEARRKAVWSSMLNSSRYSTELGVSEYFFAHQKPSHIAIAALMLSLESIPPTLVTDIERANFTNIIKTYSNIDVQSCSFIRTISNYLNALQQTFLSSSSSSSLYQHSSTVMSYNEEEEERACQESPSTVTTYGYF